MPKLEVIIASTRPNRVGLPIANWFVEAAKAHGAFEVEVSDLKEIALPLLDEPHHPRLRNYQHSHTKTWSEQIQNADAFVFVMPEYNAGFTAPLKNAIDYLSLEWAYKPAGFVSYGGLSGGTRAVQMLKEVLTTIKITPAWEAVNIPFVSQYIKDDGTFAPSDLIAAGVTPMLDELAKVESALKSLRSASV